jgi:integrase
MATVRLKYVHQFVDRHGKARHYFRRKGFKQVPLPGLPGSHGFQTAYARALAGEDVMRVAGDAPVGAGRTAPGTVNAMVIGYLASAAFHRLAPLSQRDYRRILDELRRTHGDKRIAALERRHVVMMLDAKAATPAAARNFLRCLRAIVRHAIDVGARGDDPTANVRLKGSKNGGYRTWTEDEIATFEAAHPIGTKPRLALALLLGTALRCSDVVRVGRGNVRSDCICGIVQQKTKAPLPPIPISSALAEAINAAAPGEHITFLINERGASFTAKGFGRWFTEQCNRAGLKGLSPHGLRKAACRRLAEAGCSANEIAAISGHASLNEVSRYTRAADQERMARNAIARTEGEHRSGKPGIAGDKPGERGR